MEAPQNIHPNILYAIQLLSENRNANMDKAISIIEKTVSDCDIDVCADYSSSLAGIGYGIQYLIYSGLIDANADDILTEFDQHLFSEVCYKKHTDLSHSKGLMGIAFYFFGRLEDVGANTDNSNTVMCKFVLLSILNILLTRFSVDGYLSSRNNKLPQVTLEEKKDIGLFIYSFLNHNICNELALKLLDKLIQSSPCVVEKRESSFTTDMSDVTIVIPIRIDSDVRIQNLQTIIHLYSCLQGIHFIILEADSSQLLDLKTDEKIEYIYCKDDSTIFHHTYYRNKMIRLARTPIVIVWDVDILVPLSQLYMAVEEIRKYHVVLSYPYDGICYDLTPNISKDFRRSLDWQVLLSNKDDLKTMFGELTVGGVFVIDCQKYIQLGMENEYFVGWGPEDVERLKRLTIMDIPVSRIEGCIYHLFHPRKLNSSYVSRSQYISVMNELFRICGMTKLELLREINNWEWVLK